MLIDYSLSNFRSFNVNDDEEILIMEKGTSRAKSDHVIENKAKNKSLLKLGVIFGSNASGKSNLIKGMRLVKNIITNQSSGDWSKNQYCKNYVGNRDNPVSFTFTVLANRYVLGDDLYDCIDNNSLFNEEKFVLTYQIDLSYKFSETPLIEREALFNDGDKIYERKNNIDNYSLMENINALNTERKELYKRLNKIRNDRWNQASEESGKKTANSYENEASTLLKMSSLNYDDSGEVAWINKRLHEIDDELSKSHTSKNNSWMNKSFVSINPDWDSLKETGIVKNQSKNLILESISSLYHWFDYTLEIIDPYQFTIPQLELDSFDKLSEVISIMDVGIKSIRWKKISEMSAIERILLFLSDEDKTKVKESRINSIKHKIECSTIVGDISSIYKFVCWRGEMSVNKLMTVHDDDEEYNLESESDGTKRIIELAAILAEQTSDKVYVVDELDRRLHPNLTKHFIDLYLHLDGDTGFNKQLIMTTHEVRLLTTDLLRLDELWFVERQNDGCSSLYSACDVKTLNKDLDRLYLEDGAFGGIPHID